MGKEFSAFLICSISDIEIYFVFYHSLWLSLPLKKEILLEFWTVVLISLKKKKNKTRQNKTFWETDLFTMLNIPVQYKENLCIYTSLFITVTFYSFIIISIIHCLLILFQRFYGFTAIVCFLFDIWTFINPSSYWFSYYFQKLFQFILLGCGGKQSYFPQLTIFLFLSFQNKKHEFKLYSLVPYSS